MAHPITIVGLGSGNVKELTLEACEALENASTLYLRTKDHPVAQWLHSRGIHFQTFDATYEQYDPFEQVYASIYDTIVATSQHEPVVYAVPGHPMVAERVVQLLQKDAAAGVREVHIIGGQSFLDTLFVAFGFDPVEGFQLLDATDLTPDRLNASNHTVITQMYSSMVASDVKLTLMEMYPDEHEVWIGHKLGFKEGESLVRLPLYEMDHDHRYGNYSVVFVPKVEDRTTVPRSFDSLRSIIHDLRIGCPWDREQTHPSLRRYMLEECYEAVEAIDNNDLDALCDELGDVLLQIMLHSRIAEEEGDFNILDVIENLNLKMIRRHPHVFGNEVAQSAEQVASNWQRIKEQEKNHVDRENASVLDGIPKPMPALAKAVQLQKKAAKVGFDWDRKEDVIDKIREETYQNQSIEPCQQMAELGDVLFSIANLARFLKIDPEQALSLTNAKFKHRFQYIEQQLRLNNKTFGDVTLEQMEEWWQESKEKVF